MHAEIRRLKMKALSNYGVRDTAECLLEEVGNKVRLVSVVERGNGELELVRQAHETVEVDGLVAMRLNLDASAQYVDERLPLQALGILAHRGDVLPQAGIDLCAIRVLALLDLARLVVRDAQRPDGVHARRAVHAVRVLAARLLEVAPALRTRGYNARAVVCERRLDELRERRALRRRTQLEREALPTDGARRPRNDERGRDTTGHAEFVGHVVRVDSVERTQPAGGLATEDAL